MNESIITTGNIGPKEPHKKSQISALSQLRRRPHVNPKSFSAFIVVKRKKKKHPGMNLASYLKSLKVVRDV